MQVYVIAFKTLCICWIFFSLSELRVCLKVTHVERRGMEKSGENQKGKASED